jgi:uncharacterized repeat protein (TIGR01451 family)
MANALVANPAWVTSSSFLTTANAGASDVFSTPLTFFPTGGDGDYVALSNGLTSAIPFPATFTSNNLGGGHVRGNTDYDVTIWQVGLSVPANADCLSVDLQFLSQEFPTYVGGSVNDAFVAELDTSDWTTAGSAITAPHNFANDADGNVISINSTGIGGMSGANGTGTAFDGQPDGSDSYGGATALLHAFTPITSGAHTVYFSIFDQGDQIYDSAVFLDNLRLFNSGGNCQAGAGTDYMLNLNYLGTGSGTVTKDPDQQLYAAGTVVTLTATADVGSAFVGWGGDLSGNTTPTTLTMDSDKTVDATFVDTVAPAAPVIVTPAEGAGVNDNTPVISGTAEPGSTVTVMEGATVLCTAVTDGSGNWSCTPTTPLSDGSHTISATATDEAGNVSDPATRSFTVDTIAPAAPVIVTPAEGAVVSDNTPVISGTAEPGSTVTVMEGATLLCTAVTDVSGNWSCVPTTPLSDGLHTISATATDEAGNVSDPATRSFTVDTIAPAAPVIVAPAEGAVVSDNTPTISGTAEPGSTVTVMEGATFLCTAVTDVCGNWSCVPTTPLSDGLHTISATATDEAGNVSDPATRSFTVDTIAPAAPVIIVPAEGAVISDTTPTISGNAESGSTVTVMEGATVLCTAVTNSSGIWSCVPSTPLSEGVHTISATATDEAGNVSDPATRSFIIQVTLPDADLSVSISAMRSVVNITYTIVVRNDGPSLADGAVVSATFATEMSDITWTCTGAGGAVCGGSGSGSLHDTLTSLPTGGSVTYVVHAKNVMLASDECAVSITPPVSVNDPNMANNRATYIIYRMMIPYVIDNRKP